ncbi:hypothetical protein BXZ70DRAFT_1013081 [Cristinia sonorae]|uniref:Uncharacterized protein n=1 Tax=Cristinia sonorae TaxID=1940300 RepID=A0A8K0UDP9_9AGAR|nr:hypothetical protein BXZ70DRAFT_1013081 [Cristinia sonorae]
MFGFLKTFKKAMSCATRFDEGYTSGYQQLLSHDSTTEDRQVLPAFTPDDVEFITGLDDLNLSEYGYSSMMEASYVGVEASGIDTQDSNVIFVGRSFYAAALQQESDPSQPTALRHGATYIPLVFVYTALFDTVIFTLTLLKLLYPWTKRGCLVERMLKPVLPSQATPSSRATPPVSGVSPTSRSPIPLLLSSPDALNKDKILFVDRYLLFHSDMVVFHFILIYLFLVYYIDFVQLFLSLLILVHYYYLIDIFDLLHEYDNLRA